MKSFKEFLSEATLDDEREFRSKRSATKKKGGRAHIDKSTATIAALKHAHAAKLKGDDERHAYWLKRAYARLTEKR